jgi:hypothetical protein
VELLWGILLIILACYVVYWIAVGVLWILVHVVPWSLLVVTPAVLLFFLLERELVQLTPKSAIAMFAGCGGGAWLATSSLVSGLDLPPYLALPIAPAIFFTLCILLLASWAAARLISSWSGVRAACAEAESAGVSAEAWERRVQELRAHVDGIMSEHGEAIEARMQTSEEIEILCAMEPRTLGLLATNLTEMARRMSSEELQLALAAVSDADGRIGGRLRAMVLNYELSSRAVKWPAETLVTGRAALEEAETSLQVALADRKKWDEKSRHSAEIYRAFRSGPIVL